MVIAAIMTPLQIAFVEKDTKGWFIGTTIIDISFFLDIVITFFAGYLNESTMKMVCDKKVIAKRYLKFWFWMDLLSIIPFD